MATEFVITLICGYSYADQNPSQGVLNATETVECPVHHEQESVQDVSFEGHG